MSSLPSPGPGLRALLVLCALAVVSLLYLPLPVLPQLAQAYGLSPASAAASVSAFGLAYAAGFLLFGPLSDRLGRRPLMAAALVALSLLTAALSWAPSGTWLLGLRAAQGLTAAAFPPTVIAYLSERGTPRQRVWGVAWLSTAFLSAGLAGQIYGVAMAEDARLKQAWLPLALLFALTAWRLRVASADPARGIPASPWHGAWRALGARLACPALRRVYGPASVLLLCFVAFYLGLDGHAGALLHTHGLTPLMTRALAWPALLTPLVVAAVLPRWGAQRLVTAGLLLATAGLAACAAAVAGHPYALLAASLVFVAGIGVSVPSLIARIAGLTAPEGRGLALAFYTFVLFVGASLGPWVAHLTASWTAAQAFLLLALLMMAAALYAASGRTPA
ncbi:MFS transporter [Bordetella trematum]|uniref:MFS transporter n=1 Tax=Bordetella trematum TaxID=123899 RepID=UPI0013FDDCC4|nr:MFS transporter [Bordetella trematum]